MNSFIETNCSAAGNGYSQTVGPYTVKTLCTALSTPVYEGFDNDSTGGFSNPNAPSCWYYLEETGAAGYGYIDNATWSMYRREVVPIIITSTTVSTAYLRGAW